MLLGPTLPARAAIWGRATSCRETSRSLEPHWRVSMHLFDAMTQKSISSEQHDFDLENVFDVQDEIGRQVVESLRKRFPPAVPKSRDRYSSDPEAYNEFMAGLRESYSDRPDTLESAIQHLSTAIKRDPEFALAHAWLSYVSTSMLYTFDPRPTRLEKAEHHCRRALMLDPALPEGHLARAFILSSQAKNFQHADALEALEQVLAVQPNLEQAHNRIANDLSAYRTTSRGAHRPTSRRGGRIQRLGAGTSSSSISTAGTSRALRRQARHGFGTDREPNMRSFFTHNLHF